MYKRQAKLYDFFGEKCIEYTLDRAIEEKKLTKYKYYPIVVTPVSYTHLRHRIWLQT